MGESGEVHGVRYCLHDDESAVREALDSFPKEGVVGLDTETFWDRSSNNRSSVSLVQLAAAEGEILVVDALATGIEPLRPALESPGLLMVAHNARFDRMVLSGAGVQTAGLIDTLQMARMTLRLASYSLASVVEHLFGLPLDKTYQTSNWRRRPLSKAQVSYAALDALIVLRVYEELKTRLTLEGRFEEALKASTLSDRPSQGTRQKRPKIELTPPLNAEEKRVVRKLKAWRLMRAQTENVPAYMVCQDRTLEHLVRVRPETLEALGGVYGLGSAKITRFGEDLLKALRDACS
jgi:ribonuclease D